MTGIDTSENLVPFRMAGGKRVAPGPEGAMSEGNASEGAALEGAILFDATRLRQAEPEWFDPAWWGEHAQAVSRGGRGGAWFVNQAPRKRTCEEHAGGGEGGAGEAGDGEAIEGEAAATVAGFGPAVLRYYLRGGLVAKFSRDRHLWRGPGQVRSFDEFRLLRALRRQGLPVPTPIAAIYWHHGLTYRAAILLDRLQNVRTLAELAAGEDAPALWRRSGELIARLHRAGLDHADLNADNLLFQPDGTGWVIDLDRSRIRIPATAWREANLRRLERSLLKLRGARSPERVHEDVRRLREAYDKRWQHGV
jgi:3-deoxy-D-manno-octulosonic acid kinase